MKILDVISSPWAIQPEKLNEIQSIYETHLKGDKIDIDAVEKRLGKPLNNEQKGYELVDGVAVLPIHGVIAKKMNLFSQISGGASSQLLMRDFDAAMEDDAVQSIVLSIDSPGGAVDGTQSLAEHIFKARGKKPIIALADGVMASAAYWIGSAADEIHITSGTTAVGSIGVVAKHMDISKAEADKGIKTTEIFAGKYKRIASQHGPLTKAGKESMQSQVDYLYSLFVSDVAKHRGVSEETVLEDMADGRIFIGEQAIEAGLVDGVSTMDELIVSLASQAGGVSVISINANDEGIDMNLDELKANHPDLVEAIATEAKEVGALGERERILGIEANALSGHEDLVAEMKQDGKTTPEQAAIRILNAEKAKAEARASALENDAPAAVPAADAPAIEMQAEDTSDLPVEEKCKADWEKDASLHKEFGSLKAYTAYTVKTEAGHARVFGG